MLYDKLVEVAGADSTSSYPDEGERVTVNPEDVLLDGNDVESAEPKIQSNGITGGNENIVNIKFTAEGSKKFAKITGDHISERLAIISDGILISTPTIQEAITGGECIISGGFQEFSEVEALAEKLNG